ncbi:MAG: hypothetical protein UT84_C0001G0049 [Candidatus Curtissbacteria bacterium GW2011_GWA1_40_16]|uniref:Uncharacterized protein n=1 Tax=Candidatus Curtissbacteria bacterium GW2011_GWA1_40_16 TaxID=1618405 RepID=A0A0G0RF72_9BACT|nr:MAG: hypothetical protein UT84_C0001G0049 [Candidatus Curtissbacteria bacterium GW2011_GWA1_40_16]
MVFNRIFGNRQARKAQTINLGERDLGQATLEPQEPSELVNSSEILTAFFRDLHAAGGKRRGLVDFDLAPMDPRSARLQRMFTSNPTKDERRIQFDEIRIVRSDLAKTQRPNDPDEAQQYDFLERKLLALDTVMQRRNGAIIDFHNYIELTQGITPELIAEDALEAQLEVVKALYKEGGVQNYSAESISKYRQDHLVPKDEIGTQIKERGDKFLKRASDFIGEEINPNYQVEEVQENEWWINWADGTRNSFRLRVNTHENHITEFTGGRNSVLGLHEITGHFGQMYGWQKAIDSGNLIDALGITSVTDPEQITSEGMAQTINYFVPGILNDLDGREVVETEIEIEQYGLRQMVYHNVQVWLNTIDLPEESVVGYVRKYLPAESLEDIKREIHDRTVDEAKSSYRMSYGYGFYLHKEYALCLNTEGKRELLRYIFSRPTTPQQEYEFVMNLVNDPDNRYGSGRVPFRDKDGKSVIEFPTIELLKPAA